MIIMANLMTASKQWSSRPNDERFLSLDELEQHVANRKQESWTTAPLTNHLRVQTDSDGEIGVRVNCRVKGEQILKPTNWAFNQLAQYAQAPAAYLRTLAPELAAINLQYGLERNPLRQDGLILAQTNGSNQLRALTSTSYGRIWDIDVVKAVKRVNGDGRWQIPSSSYTTSNPLRATTLYASDRDVFIFLVDPKRIIEVNGEKLYRGFFAWNSEVGSAVFGLTTFLYRYICDNRIVWGATEIKELRIRHTGGAPERFAYEGERYLKAYAEESTQKLIDGIKAAQNTEIPLNKGNDETVADWLRKRGFTKTEATGAVDAAKAEEGKVRSVWDIVNGVTAYARSVAYTDKRVELETKAGKLMEIVG